MSDAAFYNAQRDGRNRGGKVILALFGPTRSADPLTLSMTGCGTTSRERLGSRLNIAVADGNQVVIGEIRDGDKSRGIRTTTPHVILVAKEYIRHDIWGRVLIDELGEARFQQLCGENELLAYPINSR